MPGYSFHSFSRASAKVTGEGSMTIWRFPAAKERKGPGIEKVTGMLTFPPDLALSTPPDLTLCALPNLALSAGWPPLHGGSPISLPRRGPDTRLPYDSGLHANHRRQALQNLLPGLPFVGRPLQLSTACAEVDAGRVKRVCRHGIAQD